MIAEPKSHDDRACDRSPLAFALICGGSSQRMAALGNKALLPWPPPEGPPLYRSQLEKFANLHGKLSHTFVSCRSEQFKQLQPIGADSTEFIFDCYENSGPLGGISACLHAAFGRSAKFLVVLAVDLPQMPSAFLASLLEIAGRTGKGVVPKRDGRWEPLAAVYPSILSDEAGCRMADENFVLQDFVAWALENDHISEHSVTDSERNFFHNLNTPDDYTAAAAQLGRAGLQIEKHSKAGSWQKAEAHDEIATEEPLEIRVEGTSVAVVMRTPGHDEELAAGFLLTEGIAKRREDFFEISQCPSVDSDTETGSRGNVIDVLLGGEAKTRDLSQLTRHVFTSSSCGICGKATIDSVFQAFPVLDSAAASIPTLDRDLLLDLPNRLRRAQKNFQRTGGLHASALFDATSGELLLVREDVGRHNALDKVVGHAVLNGMTPLSYTVLLLSGRISFELMQKALAAGIPIIAGISAPNSLAVKFARESGQTLVGFLRDQTFNVYAGGARLAVK